MTSTGHVQSETQPYVGLRAFRQQDRGLFFGRERESREIATLWQADRLTVLYGTSGVGKTSLLHAGSCRSSAPTASTPCRWAGSPRTRLSLSPPRRCGASTP